MSGPTITEFIEKKNITPLTHAERDWLVATVDLVRLKVDPDRLEHLIDELDDYIQEYHPEYMQ